MHGGQFCTCVFLPRFAAVLLSQICHCLVWIPGHCRAVGVGMPRVTPEPEQQSLKPQFGRMPMSTHGGAELAAGTFSGYVYMTFSTLWFCPIMFCNYTRRFCSFSPCKSLRKIAYAQGWRRMVYTRPHHAYCINIETVSVRP